MKNIKRNLHILAVSLLILIGFFVGSSGTTSMSLKAQDTAAPTDVVTAVATTAAPADSSGTASGALLEPGDQIDDMVLSKLTNPGNLSHFTPAWYDLCFLQDKPGTYQSGCTLPPSDKFFIGPTWLVQDATEVDPDWKELSFEFSFDDHPIDFEAFDLFEKSLIRGYGVVIENLTAGQHTLHLVIHQAHQMSDGVTTFPAGTYDYTFTLYVHDCPVDLPAATFPASPAKPKNAAPAFVGIQVSYGDDCGVRVAQIVPGGPAEQANLVPGDDIVAINADLISSNGKLLNILKTHYAGETVIFTIERDGALMQIPVTLGTRPVQSATAVATSAGEVPPPPPPPPPPPQ